MLPHPREVNGRGVNDYTGWTNSTTDFLTEDALVAALQPTYDGGIADAFVTKIRDDIMLVETLVNDRVRFEPLTSTYRSIFFPPDLGPVTPFSALSASSFSRPGSRIRATSRFRTCGSR